jgi:DNA adenine methylase
MSDRTDDMKIKAIAPWFGSKRTLAPVIVKELGKHRAYWEPFCGAMSVLFCKPKCGHETVNDLHGDLINLARVIQDGKQGPALYRRLRRVIIHDRILEESWESLAAATEAVDRAYHYFVASWSGRNGFAGTTNVIGTKGIAVRWTPGGGHGGLRFTSAVDSIPAWRQRLRRVTVLQRDAFSVIEKIDDAAGVAIYCDPPYLAKDATYEHDFSDGFMHHGNDHERLASALARFKRARVVVSYYADPALKAMYPGWTQLDCTMTKGIHNAGKRGQVGKKAPECLLINGPSHTSEAA